MADRPIQFGKTLIDQYYETKDIHALHWAVAAILRGRQLPEQFWLFLRLWEWTMSTRSGVWSYYEVRPADLCSRVAESLERFGLKTVARKYRVGMGNWQRPSRCRKLNQWVEDNYEELLDAAFGLIAKDRQCLYGEPEKNRSDSGTLGAD